MRVFVLPARIVVCLASLASLPTLAQTTAAPSAPGSDLEEVVVTAEHRAADLQKVGLSITAISGADLARLGAADDAQVLQNVPGVVLQGITDGPSAQSVQGGGGPPNIAIRGLGTPSPNTVGAVAVYEDGVLLMGGGANFYDMSRVEVLRGPQGTLYGRGATAGAVNYLTNDPNQQFSASGRIQYGSYDLIATQGTLNIPLSSDWSVRAAFNQIRHNGFFNNGQSDENDISTRVKLLYKPSDAFSLLFGVVAYKSDGSGPGQVLLTTNPNPSDWTTKLGGGSTDSISYRKTYVDLEWKLGAASLTYLGGYQTTDSTFSFNWNGFFGFSYLSVPQPINQTWTHELRLASANDSALSWQAGAYYYGNKLKTAFEPGMPPATGAVYTPAFAFAQSFSPTSLGLFGELTYAVTSSTRLTGGLRETRDHVVETQTFEPGGSGGVPTVYDVKLNRLDWRARLETDVAADKLLYGSVSTGYRPGGFVNGIKSENEYVTAYEVGSKNRLGPTLTLNGALYYNDYSGFQNVASIPDPVTGALNTVLVPLPATFYGLELELVAQFSPNDKLALAPAFESAKYTKDIVAGGFYTNGGTIPNTPKTTLSGSYEHSFALSSGSRVNWNVDAHYQAATLSDFDPSNYMAARQINPVFQPSAYTIVNSSLSFAAESGKYTVTAYGKNLGNTLYKVSVYNANPPSAFVNDPRTFGVMISAKL